MKLRFLLVPLFVLCSMAASQSKNHAWIITIATGDTLSQCSLISLDGDSLRVSWSGFPVSLPVESLLQLRYHRPSEFWRGAFYGSAAGALVGTLVSASSQESSAPTSGMVGTLCGFIVGGFSADYFSRDDRYNFTTNDIGEKKAILNALLMKSSLHAGEVKQE
jgi:hypothetical protein